MLRCCFHLMNGLLTYKRVFYLFAIRHTVAVSGDCYLYSGSCKRFGVAGKRGVAYIATDTL